MREWNTSDIIDPEADLIRAEGVSQNAELADYTPVVVRQRRGTPGTQLALSGCLEVIEMRPTCWRQSQTSPEDAASSGEDGNRHEGEAPDLAVFSSLYPNDPPALSNGVDEDGYTDFTTWCIGSVSLHPWFGLMLIGPMRKQNETEVTQLVGGCTALRQ